MRDPVITSDGQTYEREAIENWLSKNQTSPATNLELPDKVLKPNIALKKAIRSFLEQYPELSDEVYFSKALELQFIEACKTMRVEASKVEQGTKEVTSLILLEKRFFSHTFENGGSVLHIVAQFSAHATFKVVWESFQKSQSIERCLIEPDSVGCTPLVITKLLTILLLYSIMLLM
jgi:hypothetical protein